MKQSNPQILNPKTGKPFAEYAGTGRGFGDQLTDWFPSTKTADAALLPSLDLGNARAEDLARNNGIAANGVQLHVDNIVGHRFRLSHKPMHTLLGITREDAIAFAKECEAAWNEHAEDEQGCYIDAERKSTATMLIRQLVATHTIMGEAMVVPIWEGQPGSLFKTSFKTISPKRVSNPDKSRDTDKLRKGVEINRFGAAVAYHVQNHSLDGFMGTGLGNKWVRIPRETSWGRQLFIHAFEPREDGQTRGANQFLSVMEQLRMLSKLQHTKLQNAIVNAMYAAVIETELGSDAAMELIGSVGEGRTDLAGYMGSVSDYYENRSIRMNGVKIPHLLPQESLNLATSGNVDNGFVELESSILRWISAGLNLPYEQLAKDYSKVSYSSARASMLEGFRYTLGRRKVIAAKIASSMFALWVRRSRRSRNYQASEEGDTKLL